MSDLIQRMQGMLQRMGAKPDELFTWEEDPATGELVCRDATGKEVRRCPRGVDKHGQPLVVFQQYEARLVRDYPHESLVIGDTVTAKLMPNGFMFLSHSEGCFETDAHIGADFDWV